MVEIPKTVNLPVSQLKVDGNNPNKLEARHFAALKQNILRFGFLVPIIVNKDFLVADGEHRLKAAVDLGMSEVPVVVLDVKEVDRLLLRQVLNKLRGRHDKDLDWGEYERILGFGGGDDLKGLLGWKYSEFCFVNDHFRVLSEDSVPVVSSPVSVVGDLWLLGRHRLLVGDSLLAGNYDLLGGGFFGRSHCY